MTPVHSLDIYTIGLFFVYLNVTGNSNKKEEIQSSMQSQIIDI